MTPILWIILYWAVSSIVTGTLIYFGVYTTTRTDDSITIGKILASLWLGWFIFPCTLGIIIAGLPYLALTESGIKLLNIKLF